MNLNRVIVIFTLFLMICIPITICSFSEDVVATDGNTEVVEGRNLFEEFYYRLFLKDTKDFYDYVMLGTFIVGLLIVMVFQNTHYYIVKVDKPNLEIPVEETETIVDEKPKYEKKYNYERRNHYQQKRHYQKKKKINENEN